jgi:hypothetical protein
MHDYKSGSSRQRRLNIGSTVADATAILDSLMIPADESAGSSHGIADAMQWKLL